MKQPTAAWELFWWIMTIIFCGLGIALIYFIAMDFSPSLWASMVIFALGLPLSIANLRRIRIARRRDKPPAATKP